VLQTTQAAVEDQAIVTLYKYRLCENGAECQLQRFGDRSQSPVETTFVDDGEIAVMSHVTEKSVYLID
jgi:hypothetical protein